MRQRVAVARALAMQPKVLLMDEPFAALDVQTRVKMQGFLLDVWDVSKASVLFVTHHIDEAIALADRVVVFTARPGRIKAIVPIDLPRPRDLTSPAALALRVELTALLQDEVDRAFAEQEACPSRADGTLTGARHFHLDHSRQACHHARARPPSLGADR